MRLLTESTNYNLIDINIRDKLFKYIGNRDLPGSNYQKSYKIALLTSLINNANSEGKADYNKVCEDIVSYYWNRNKANLSI